MRLKFGIAMLLLACASLAMAQNTNSADIRGTTTDQTGAILRGVNVSVVDVTKGVTTTYVSNDAGLYDTGPIVPDSYTITFTKDGFGPWCAARSPWRWKLTPSTESYPFGLCRNR